MLCSVIIRLVSIYFFGDLVVDKEWGIMLKNLEQNNILSIRSIDGVPVPNIFMPPLYPLFLYAIKIFINDISTFLNATLIMQLILSITSIILFNKILLELFSKNFSLIGTLVYSFFPLNVYAVSQISSITLQMLLINIFILSFIKLFKIINVKDVLFFSVSSALLILLRGEFFIFVFLSLIYLFASNKKNFGKIISISFLIILIISPYLYRNYKIFGTITITKSFGYNLLKGSNPSVLIWHGNFITLYTNLAKLYVKKGEKVNAKQAIGEVFTNQQTGKTQLQFGIFNNVKALNPKDWVYQM